MCNSKINLSVWWFILSVIFNVCASAGEHRGDVNCCVHTTMGYGLELLLTKLDILTSNLHRMEKKFQSLEVKQQNMNDNLQTMKDDLRSVEDKCVKSESKLLKIEHDIEEHRSKQELSHKEMIAAIQKLERQVAANVSEVYNGNQQNVHASLHELDRDLGCVLYNQYYGSTFSSCKNVPSNVSGTYLIRVKNDSDPFKVYCEQEAFGGGWIVFQYRYDGSLDFYRGWDEFRDGFGDLNKEFWLGLEKMHQITSGRKHELMVELKDFSGNYKYARYNAFEIGTESAKYNLKVLGNYTGTAGNAMYFDKGSKFSTKDQNNDADSTTHCALHQEGAWWHWDCTRANLNGRYMNAEHYKSMRWNYFAHNNQGLSYSRMMIRELE
uniref:Putative ficolin n=2 Tax=Anopheles triannulatus TaxID=58253 RepID=A0A2M4ARN8_9DIPT